MNTVLIPGGLGYIGSHTTLKLIENGIEVIVLDNLSNSNIKALYAMEKISNKKIKFYNADIRDVSTVRGIFKENKIDAVINFAGYKAVGESVENPLSYFDNNLIGIIKLLQIMEEFSVKNIVFSSSATVYGVPEKVPMLESDKVGATNPYARTKVVIEQILEDLSYSDPEWNIISLRYFNPLGAHKSGEIGENPNGIPNNLAPYITQVAVGKLEMLHVFGDDYNTPDGTCIRDYIHIDDLAQGHLAAIEKISYNPKGYEVYNLGSGKGYSVLEIIENFENIIGDKIPYKIVGRRSGDIDISFADISKAREFLNWEPIKDIQEMCQDTWNWQRKHPNGFELN
ncbi:UDP-glucose 4-epimerase GalE [Niallia sp. HCP3S3_B10]|uniref:UDP-glucose 4-epimerase GalE n=1 Tax=Niallia sp. HCP3S3_B10 TaxID=3438944 RepID=UPI003F89CF63